MSPSTAPADATVSKSRTDKAGERLRRMELDPHRAVLDGVDYDVEMAVLKGWRLMHSLPMRSTRSLLLKAYEDVTNRSSRGVVYSRLKREEQIIAKLCRQRTRLSTIEDIGGCRAIVQGLEEAESLVAQIKALTQRASVRMVVLSVDDYITHAQASGYRGVHLHCERDGRQIEVQVRTRRQHTWADFVEEVDGAFGLDAKHGDAPEPLLDALRSLSEGLHAKDLDGHTIYADMRITAAVNALQSSLDDLRRGRRDDHA